MSSKNGFDECSDVLLVDTWNYRVVKKGEYLGIHDTYYDNYGRVRSISLEPAAPQGEDLVSLRTTLELMLVALNDDVLDFDQTDSE